MMSIRTNLPVNDEDQEKLYQEFKSFGDCNFETSVTSKQKNALIVYYNSINHAKEAIEKLNGKVFSDTTLIMHLLPAPLLLIPSQQALISSSEFQIREVSDEPKSTIMKYNNIDIEIILPAPQLSLVTNNSENTPLSTNSPCFPEHSSFGSPRSPSLQNEYNPSESPISVRKLPIAGSEWEKIGGKVIDIVKADEVIKVENIRNQENDEKEDRIGVERKKLGEKNEMVMCEICQRQIKKRSFTAHLKTKIHLTSLKMK